MANDIDRYLQSSLLNKRVCQSSFNSYRPAAFQVAFLETNGDMYPVILILARYITLACVLASSATLSLMYAFVQLQTN